MRIRESLIAVFLIACGPRPTTNMGAPPPVAAEPSPAESATPTEAGSQTTTTSTTTTSTTPVQQSAAGADGSACLKNDDCASGVCEGQGCDDAHPGVCAAKTRACTRDLRQYCGCDGKTFATSGSCPGRRYAAKGACPATAP
jgi:hypothetical protein